MGLHLNLPWHEPPYVQFLYWNLTHIRAIQSSTFKANKLAHSVFLPRYVFFLRSLGPGAHGCNLCNIQVSHYIYMYIQDHIQLESLRSQMRYTSTILNSTLLHLSVQKLGTLASITAQTKNFLNILSRGSKRAST